MKNKNTPNWTNHPTLTHLTLMFMCWIITLVLVVLVLTNFFADSFSLQRNPAIAYLFIFGSWGVSRIYKTYNKHKKDAF